ncbi:MAG: hypothetical protein QM775_11505 [Pirellulales bacterium]
MAGAVDAEVRLAELEWLVASALSADDAKDAKSAADFRERAAAMGRLIEERHSPYFARRAETLLATSVSTATSGTHDDGALAKAAESFYRQGNVDKALELYDQLFTQAGAAKQDAAAFDAAFTAAALEQQRSRFAAAAERFEKLAAALPRHVRAGEASLLAAYNLGQSLAAAADAKSAAAGLERYAALLKSHIAARPTDRTTTQARLWLAKVELQLRRPREALMVLQDAPPGDPSAEQVVAALRAAGDAELAASTKAADRSAAAEVYATALERFVPTTLDEKSSSSAHGGDRRGPLALALRRGPLCRGGGIVASVARDRRLACGRTPRGDRLARARRGRRGAARFGSATSRGGRRPVVGRRLADRRAAGRIGGAGSRGRS